MERWKAVKGYEGYYEVSDFGRVRRVGSASGTQTGRLLKPTTIYYDTGGRKPYLCAVVSLSKDSQVRRFRLSRLVSETFYGPCPKGIQVNHKDGNPLNNELSNLEYATNRDNALHASKMGLLVHGEDHQGAKITEQDVLDIREAVARGTSTYENLMQHYGLNKSTIWAIVYHRTWKHVGGPPPPTGDLRIKKQAKLTEEKVRAIRRLHAEGVKLVRLSEMFGVTDSTLHSLVNRKTWKHVT